jgi:hypothetical protein
MTKMALEEPLSCKERGRGEVMDAGPANRKLNRSSGEVSLHAENVRPLTLPSPSGRGFRVEGLVRTRIGEGTRRRASPPGHPIFSTTTSRLTSPRKNACRNFS